MRKWRWLFGCSVGAGFAVAACVGNDPSPSSIASAEPDGGGVSTVLGSDASPPGDGGSDVESGPLCGYAGEACCTGPFAPCGTGTTCSITDKVCVVSDLWATGDYVDISTFEHNGVSAHYDGTKWSPGPAMGNNEIPYGLWGSAPGQYYAATNKGKVLLFNSGTPSSWLVCGDFGCSDPMTTNALYAVYGFGQTDFWTGGSNAMFQCNGATCTAKTTGLPATWGQGNFTGTSSKDLWYSGFDRAFHYDGTSWTTHAGIQARSMWAHSATDVWAGDATLQHYDGTNWSPPYDIDGAPAPGNIMAMSGTASDDVWAIGYNGSIASHPAFSAHWDGHTWSLKLMPVDAGQVQSLWAASKKEVFASSFDGGLYKWNGTAWSAMVLPTQADGGAFAANWDNLGGSARPRP